MVKAKFVFVTFVLLVFCCFCFGAEEVDSAGKAALQKQIKPKAKKAKKPAINFAGAKWIWGGKKEASTAAETFYFRKGFVFEAGSKPVAGEIIITCDNQWVLYVNGNMISRGNSWQQPQRINISEHLIIEQNSIAVEGVNTADGPAGLIVKMKVVFENGEKFELISDETWVSTKKKESGWNETGFVAGESWHQAKVVGVYGSGPWGKVGAGGKAAVKALKKYKKEVAFEGAVFSDGIVFVRGHLPFVSHDANNYIQNVHGSRAYFEMDPPTPAAIGRQLVSLVPFRPDGKVTVLCDAKGGVLGSPSVSYDGKTIYFTLAKKGEAYYHVYAVGSDGKNLRQVTRGPFHDYDPVELPDGRIVFSSTRIGNREEYHAKYASSLFVCDGAGGNILPLTYHIVADREPRVTASGSLTFIRSDNFLERAKVETHLHQVRMDGTGGQVIIGPGRGGITYDRGVGAESNSNWLRKYGVGSCAPLPDGRVAAINQKGVVTSASATGELLLKDFVPYDMSPLPDGRLLCTSIYRGRFLVFDPANGDVREIIDVGDLEMPAAGKVNLTKGYRKDEVHSVVHLGERVKPAVMPSMVDAKADRGIEKTGFLYCQNALNTQHVTADLKRVKAVRIYEGRPFTIEPTKSIYVHIGTVGAELGTVPLAEDGSFYVEVPADRPLAMQAVDGEGRAVVNEMSWVYVRPGEQRACVGCHAAGSSAPVAMVMSDAIKNKPLKMLGQGAPHRFRANNGANGGVLNLQLDRFREAAAINLPASSEELLKMAGDSDADVRLSAIRRMGIFRGREFVGVLIAALANEKSAEIRCAAALSLAACGDRAAVKGLFLLRPSFGGQAPFGTGSGLGDRDATVRNAVRVALEHLTGGVIVDASGKADWGAIEGGLIARLSSEDVQEVYLAIEALGHVGGAAGAKAIRAFLDANPDAELRVAMAAMRSLGYLADGESVGLLTKILNDNLTKKGGSGFNELGFGQRPIYLSATAAEALGLIGTVEAEKAVLDAFGNLNNFSDYVFRVAEHEWLKGCHASILHYRMLEGLDRMESKNAGAVVGKIVESLPADKDRGLLYELDSYEALSARVIGRCGAMDRVTEACLAVLGEGKGESDEGLVASVSLSPHCKWHIRKYSAEGRAAQVLSIVCSDVGYAGRIRKLLEKFRRSEPSEKRSWCCFYLTRGLGRLGDVESAELLMDMLANDPTESAAGLNPPPTHIIYKGWRPFYRPAAAWALGMMKEKRAVGVLLDTVENLDNASSTRQAAAIALGRIGDRGSLKRLIKIGEDYPEVTTRRSILESVKSIE